MKFCKLVREDTHVQTIYDKPNADGHLEQFDITAHEAPHPEMDKALSDLIPVVKSINELASVNSIVPYGITVSYSKHGTRKTSILFRRKLEATQKVYKFKTPAFQIDDPAEDEETDRQCSSEEAELIEALIDEGIRYANGERLQMLLPLEKESEPSDGQDESGEEDMFEKEGE